ncbi:DJ-1/PfpI family protein [Edaphobacter bradus]|uniref:DJ-1/PfpI family protein n=1 Tax=Edaphobacter bradus TaxID=2259016 RepID=UPI0021DFC5A5|nr:DJ-1/PfpI family protein [Edaphobacter bradus]
MKIRDSVAFVTGADRGIGLVFAQELLAAGARKVYAAARNQERIPVDGVTRIHLDETDLNTVASAKTLQTESSKCYVSKSKMLPVLGALIVLLFAAQPLPVLAQSAGKVLIIMSSARQLVLNDGKVYNTGYYLPELADPLRKLLDAGYTPVFANPKGDAPNFDPVSNDKFYFGNSDQARASAVALVESMQGLKHPMTLAQVLEEGTDGYVGIFIPGGHAPMQDLMQDKTLGQILLAFHSNGRPTALICHGPMALLSTVSDPVAFRAALAKRDYVTAATIAKDWPYAGYRLTVFSSAEEHMLEGSSGQLGGQVQFYPPDGLAQAGAHVDHVGLWQPNVIEDREVITGQQPGSSELFGDALVAKLRDARH